FDSNPTGDTGVTSLVKTLEINKTITTVDLYNNQIDSSGALSLAKALEINNTITTIDLAGNQIVDSGASLVAKALEINKTITTIYFNGSSSTQYDSMIQEYVKRNKLIYKNLFIEFTFKYFEIKDLVGIIWEYFKA